MRWTIIVGCLAAFLLAGCAEDQPVEGWRVQELGTNAEFRDVYFLDAQRGWIVGGGHNIEGGIVGATEDGGRSWRFRSAVVSPSPRATSFHLNGVWFLDERRGVIVGDGFRILRTVDGGEHWHRAAPAHRVSAHLLDVQFVDEQFGWAIGPGGFVRSVDGGASWRGPRAVDEDGKPLPAPRGRAIHFLDQTRGWLVGTAGSIRSTTDGGETWTTVDGPPASGRPDLWGVDFVDARHGWTVGEDGTILHTSDGGKTWRRQSSGVRDILMDVDFVDATHGWAVGFERRNGSSVVLRTDDGGTTWIEQARVATEAIRALFALDSNNAWAVGRQQRRTADDGTQKLLRYEVP